MNSMKLSVLLGLVVTFSFNCVQVFAGDKLVQLETIPPGAQVEVNGSVTCVTPCSLKVPGYYFGKKRTAFSSHGIAPIRARLTREGYVPKTVELTIGPIQWKNLYGNNLFDYYLMSSDRFNFQLDAVQEFVPTNSSGGATLVAATTTTSLPQLPVEDVVRQALPSVVTVSTSKGSGSGFFISSDGVVVTNAHVVRGESTATVTMASGKSSESTHIYVDEARDLALIKVAIRDNEFLKLSASAPALGSDVIAIGTPGAHDVTGTLMLPNSITKGIVSGVREFPENTTASVEGRAGLWIQTDATINHGNSGGPLLNRAGEVVGINTLAFTATGTPGLNFALASTELSKMMRNRFGVQPPPTPAPVNSAVTSLQAVSAATSSNTALSNATVKFESNPPGADVEVDGVFMGSTPAELPLALGQRSIRLSKKGFKPYQRSIQVLSGGAQRITVDLESE